MPKPARTPSSRADDRRHEAVTTPVFETMREEILRRAQPRSSDDCVDLGAAAGLLTFPLAKAAKTVLAVDVAQGVVDKLDANVRAAGMANVTTMAADLAALALPWQSVDLVVSNYALHHVYNADKRAIVRRARRWLRPGGRLVVGDMMFGRGLSSGDAQVLRGNVRDFAAKGPSGYWRIAKNVVRFGLRIGGRRPAPPQFWIKALEDAGFSDVGHVQVAQERGIVWGRIG